MYIRQVYISQRNKALVVLDWVIYLFPIHGVIRHCMSNSSTNFCYDRSNCDLGSWIVIVSLNEVFTNWIRVSDVSVILTFARVTILRPLLGSFSCNWCHGHSRCYSISLNCCCTIFYISYYEYKQTEQLMRTDLY